MYSEEKSENIIIRPYKDVFRNYLIDTEDMLEWLTDEQMKDEVDNCLNNL